MRFFSASVLAAALMAAPAVKAATIDFSTNNGGALSGGDILTSFDFGGGLTGTIAASGGSGDAMIFDSTTTTGGDSDLNFGAGAFGNILIISEDGDQSDPDDNASGGTITFTFDTAVVFESVSILDAETSQPISVNLGGANLSPLQTNGNNLSSTLLASAFPNAVVPVTTITFNFGGSGAIDNLAVTAVPLPAAGLLLLAGLGVMRLTGRRKA